MALEGVINEDLKGVQECVGNHMVTFELDFISHIIPAAG